MAGELANPQLRFWRDLAAWARELPEAARLDLYDDGKTVEMHGVSREKRHQLKLFSQRAAINPQTIEALLYLWLYKSVGKPGAIESSCRYFHERRVERSVYRGNSKFEGNQIVGYFYPLGKAVLEYCDEMVQGAEPEASTTPDSAKLNTSAGQWGGSQATALTSDVPAQRRGAAQSESAHSAQVAEPSRPLVTKERSLTGQAADDIAKTRAETVAKLIEELNILRPQMFEDEAEYDLLQTRHPGYLTFKIAEERPDLKRKILCIRGSARHIRLAHELAGAHYGLSPQTVADAWKDHKPTRYKRTSNLRQPASP